MRSFHTPQRHVTRGLPACSFKAFGISPHIFCEKALEAELFPFFFEKALEKYGTM